MIKEIIYTYKYLHKFCNFAIYTFQIYIASLCYKSILQIYTVNSYYKFITQILRINLECEALDKYFQFYD